MHLYLITSHRIYSAGGSMGEADMPAIVHYNRDRRRSSFTRPMRDPEEILEGLRTLKAAKGELNRTMSLTGDKRRGSREYKRFLAFSWPSLRSFVRPSSVCLSVFVPLHSLVTISTIIFTAFCDNLLSLLFSFLSPLLLFNVSRRLIASLSSSNPNSEYHW